MDNFTRRKKKKTPTNSFSSFESCFILKNSKLLFCHYARLVMQNNNSNSINSSDNGDDGNNSNNSIFFISDQYFSL